jgi:hypothetical protein
MPRHLLKRSFIILVSVCQLLSIGRVGTVFADTNPTSTNKTSAVPTDKAAPATNPPAATAPSPTNTKGPTSPTGDDSRTYHFNEATGLWENDYYTWNPVTQQTTPKQQSKYSYNPTTGKWDTTDYKFSAAAGAYVPNIVTTDAPPLNATPLSTKPGVKNPALVDTAAPTSGTNSVGSTTSNNGTFDNFYNASISNKVHSTAVSGDATIAQNTLGGNAGSGDTSDKATIINMLQSVWDPTNGTIANFTVNIPTITGDLVLDPGQIPKNVQVTKDTTNKLTVKNDQNTAINNDINLSATSGNATLNDNTKAGNVTTGNSNAVANVVNLLNSVIGSGQSFVGTVNVNGDFNGDILLPPAMLTQLLASNVPRTTIDTTKVSNSNILSQFNSNTAINNNVNATADSGSVVADQNSRVGDAASGSAKTNVTVLNLTGRKLVGSNALLVFVNVLGSWVGMIMDAPGATSAALGGGVTDTSNTNAAITTNENTAINNNIKLAAQSGNATADHNTEVGNVKSGNATASANIANVSNSKLSLTGWFGILFINVFGNWHGSFGVNTSAGDKPSVGTPFVNGAQPTIPDVQVFKFVPAASTSTSASTYKLASVPTTQNLGTSASASTGKVLGATTTKPAPIVSSSAHTMNLTKAYLGLTFVTLLLLAGGKLVTLLLSRFVF